MTVANTIAYYNMATIKTVQSFKVNHIKLFCYKFTHTFYKLYHFINISNICCIAMKRCSLSWGVSKFTQKKFYEIDPWDQCYNRMSVIYEFL
jgi:hypothetical protein